jgi:hypothetical protein
MRITSIGLYSSKGVEIANLSFRDPGSLNPYIAKNITGLDADEIVPRFYGLSTEKNKYFDLSIPSREIVLNIVLNPMFGNAEKSYSDLRDDIYKSLAASRTGIMQLRFYDGDEERAVLSGFVTKMEYPHFSDAAPEIQLSLRCEDPMLRSRETVSLRGSASEISTLEVVDSTAPHGFKFQITFVSWQSSFSIKDPNGEWSFDVNPETGFQPGDHLVFSSETGNKELNMIRTYQVTHLVDKIGKGSIWPQLFPGINKFKHPVGITWNYITYYPTYWGI